MNVLHRTSAVQSPVATILEMMVTGWPKWKMSAAIPLSSLISGYTFPTRLEGKRLLQKRQQNMKPNSTAVGGSWGNGTTSWQKYGGGGREICRERVERGNN